MWKLNPRNLAVFPASLAMLLISTVPSLISVTSDHVEIKSKEFGRIATQNAKNVILQKIREEERSVIYNQYFEKEKDVVTGIVQRYRIAQKVAGFFVNFHLYII